MTLHEVRQYLQTLYSSGSSESCSEAKMKRDKISKTLPQSSIGQLTTMPKLLNLNNNNKYSNPLNTDSSTTNTPISNKSSNGLIQQSITLTNINNNNNNNNNSSSNAKKHKKNSLSTLKHKKVKDDQLQRGDDLRALDGSDSNTGSNNREKIKKSQRNFSLNLKQTLCNIFRFV
jgi:suppressor of cytokine signaling 7